MEEENLRLHRVRDGGWKLVGSGRVDPDDDVVRGTIEGFSVYAVLDAPHGMPVAAITSPMDGASFAEGTVISFQGSASDPFDGNLHGENLTWTSSLDGFLKTGAAFISPELDSELSRGSHVITLTATDSHGASASDSVTITIVSPNEGPSIEIVASEDGATFEEGDEITFEGTASDDEDGDLSTSITWSSDQDGELGTGATLSTSTLSVGEHVITASVTDDGGITTTDQITVTVEVE